MSLGSQGPLVLDDPGENQESCPGLFQLLEVPALPLEPVGQRPSGLPAVMTRVSLTLLVCLPFRAPPTLIAPCHARLHRMRSGWEGRPGPIRQ